eukprot:2611541-Pleurochrysis_carterae.AAC.2
MRGARCEARASSAGLSAMAPKGPKPVRSTREVALAQRRAEAVRELELGARAAAAVDVAVIVAVVVA